MVAGYVAKSTVAKICCFSCKQMFGSRELESLNLDIDSNVLCYFDTINKPACMSVKLNTYYFPHIRNNTWKPSCLITPSHIVSTVRKTTDHIVGMRLFTVLYLLYWLLLTNIFQTCRRLPINQ